MKLPNGDRAIVEDRKLLEYVLSPVHPHGRTHAFLFERLLGISRDNAGILKLALLKAAVESDAVERPDEGFGPKYEIRFSIDGPKQAYTVLSIWMISSLDPQALPRLITAYIE